MDQDQRTRKTMMHKALRTKDDIDNMCQEKEKEGILLALMMTIARMHQYKYLNTTLKRTKKG